jgi:hypothetical protein
MNIKETFSYLWDLYTLGIFVILAIGVLGSISITIIKFLKSKWEKKQ